MDNNSLQERTGQVAPTAQSPQPTTQQPYQQPVATLQQTNSQLLQGGSGVRISIPANNSTSTTVKINDSTPVPENNTIGLSIVAGLFLFAAVLVVVISFLPRRNNSPEVKNDEEVQDDTPTKPVKAKKTKKTKKKR